MRQGAMITRNTHALRLLLEVEAISYLVAHHLSFRNPHESSGRGLGTRPLDVIHAWSL